MINVIPPLEGFGFSCIPLLLGLAGINFLKNGIVFFRKKYVNINGREKFKNPYTNVDILIIEFNL